MITPQTLFLIIGGTSWSCLMIIIGRLLEQHYQKDRQP